MAAARKVVVIGLDAADRRLLQHWTASGDLPNFQRLFAGSAWADSGNLTGLVAGTVWPTFYTGVGPGRTGRFRGTTQFVAGSYEHRDIDFARHAFPAFWDVLGAAGCRCAIIDAPYAFLSTAPNVKQLVDWCAHSPWKDGVTLSSPPGFADEVRGRYGRDPIGKCDFATLDTAHDFAAFRDGLIRRIEQRTALTLELLAGQSADLLLQVYSECHCAGHQLWHLHDPSHPQHDPALVAELGGDPLLAVYRALDRAIGHLLAAVTADTAVMVFCSHGIGPAYTGTHVLDEILLRVEGRDSPRRRQALAQRLVASWTRLPQRLRTRLTPLQKAAWPRLKARLVQPGKARRKFFEIIANDASGGIRFNVRGREPEGTIARGAEYDALCAMLTQELLAVTNELTGQPLVRRVINVRERYFGPGVDMLPDLLVEWSRVGPIGAVSSPRIGRIERKFEFANHRTGDHTEDDGLVFMVAAPLAPGHVGAVSVADLPPTITALFGVPFPGIDGQPVTALLEPAARSGLLLPQPCQRVASRAIP
jgi:predicted AlkP superfamily phosphohydrolase/phosphomutase